MPRDTPGHPNTRSAWERPAASRDQPGGLNDKLSRFRRRRLHPQLGWTQPPFAVCTPISTTLHALALPSPIGRLRRNRVSCFRHERTLRGMVAHPARTAADPDVCCEVPTFGRARVMPLLAVMAYNSSCASSPPQPGLPLSGVGLIASTWRKDSDTVRVWSGDLSQALSQEGTRALAEGARKEVARTAPAVAVRHSCSDCSSREVTPALLACRTALITMRGAVVRARVSFRHWTARNVRNRQHLPGANGWHPTLRASGRRIGRRRPVRASRACRRAGRSCAVYLVPGPNQRPVVGITRSGPSAALSPADL